MDEIEFDAHVEGDVLRLMFTACHPVLSVDSRVARIASLYGDLVDVTRSPIVELNRAVAVSMADGPAAGLAVVDELLDVPALRTYHLLPSVRGDLLAKLGRARSGEVREAGRRTDTLTGALIHLGSAWPARPPVWGGWTNAARASTENSHAAQAWNANGVESPDVVGRRWSRRTSLRRVVRCTAA